MTKKEFLAILKNNLYTLLSNGEEYFFMDIPENKDNFLKYTQEYLTLQPKYKNNYWFEIDDKNYSIKLNLEEETNKFFINNKIPCWVKSLDASDFEKVSIILFRNFLGSIIEEEHKSSRDDGIDFYGKYTGSGIEVSGFTNFFETNTWYIGQVKQYKKENTIGTKYIRELLGTLELAKHNIWSVDNNYTNINIKSYESVIPIFLTSSQYSNYVITIAEKFNIKLLDDIDLIFWLTIIYKADLEKLKKDLVNFGK